MSQLEMDVKPILVGLTDGDVVRLDLHQQAVLLRWALKTAGMFEFTNPSGRAFSGEVLQWIAAPDGPPPGAWWVGAARVEGVHRFALSHAGGHLDSDEGVVLSASQSLLAAGETLLVVRHCSDAGLTVRGVEGWPRLHPDPGRSVEWPAPLCTDARWEEVRNSTAAAWLAV